METAGHRKLQKTVLDDMRKRLPKTRVYGNSFGSSGSAPEYKYINYDPELIRQGVAIFEQEDDEVVIFDGVPETMQALKQRGFYLGIITDTKKAAPTGMGTAERAKTTHSKADQIARVYCSTVCVSLSK